MKHPKEEELIAYHDGEAANRELISRHMSDCPECQQELARIDALLAAINTIPVPEPPADYGQRVWQQISPRLPQRHAHWWDFLFSEPAATNWLAPRRLVALGAIAAIVLAAFIAGRISKAPVTGTPVAVDANRVRERILWMAVGEHLGRSEMVLVELSNSGPQTPAQKLVNISGEQRRAEDLLDENRLYRQTAIAQGDPALANLLDELERVLLDVAHSPQQVTVAQLDGMRQRIEARNILFKVRVVGKELEQREQSGNTGAPPNVPAKTERKRV